MLGFTSLSLAWSPANTGATTAATGDQLYGLSLVKNPPTRVSLNTVSPSTGNVSLLAADPKPGELFGSSEHELGDRDVGDLDVGVLAGVNDRHGLHPVSSRGLVRRDGRGGR